MRYEQLKKKKIELLAAYTAAFRCCNHQNRSQTYQAIFSTREGVDSPAMLDAFLKYVVPSR